MGDCFNDAHIGLVRNDAGNIVVFQAGVFKGKVRFEDYTDASFVPTGRALKPWEWEGKK